MIIQYCKVCGKEFKVYPSYIKRGRGIFCSKKCWGKWMSLSRRGKNSPVWKDKIKRKCLNCGKEFKVYPSAIKHRVANFCSDKCLKTSQRISRKGKNNPHWKDGISPENVRIRASIECRLWRETVFARDNWTCQGENHPPNLPRRNGEGKKVYLEAHHIKSFAKYPELRFAIDNGLTLCRDCHILTRKKKCKSCNSKKGNKTSE